MIKTKEDFNLIRAVASRLRIDLISEVDRRVLETRRNGHILAHYQTQIAKGCMDPFSAVDRVIGDLMGRNYHGTKTQRGELRT